ncbi:hypothetical protein SAMN05660649_03500 [Desulfotomaculum arcticum]|uniref:Uncharacterized protein n=1 Tax=Desulfotruncus arcticus DSM 17038 TaxID=1121424 RepID=A0A1I2WH06_9FIRM|nr:hypothetical protein [Desulfotruncus arcticus]SFH00528.1 hypothetical protein SAMN05660649_03500 [Desulfotomaculum arcticum] [Desulfotruncus arcticus DSM 17038]
MNINTSGLITRTRSIVFAGLAMVYLLNTVLQNNFLNYTLSGISVLCLLVCLPFAKGNARVLTLILLVAGAVVLTNSGADSNLWINSLSQNANLITLLILVPAFGIPLRYGGYYEVLDALVNKYMNNKHRIYWVPALLCHFFGALMNMGAIPVVYQLIIHGKLPQEFKKVPAAILRGFSASIFWSPNMISVALVTHYLQVSWAEFARVGIFFTILTLLVGWLVYIMFDKSTPDCHVPPINQQLNGRKIAELIFFCLAFLGSIIYIATKTSITVLHAVPVLALVFPVLWLCSLRRAKSILPAYLDYMENTLPRFTSEVAIFIGAGFLTAAMLSSDYSDQVSLLFRDYLGVNLYFLCFFIVSSIVLLSVVGITPMITAMAYSASLKPDLMGISPHLLSLVIIGGWAAGVIVSPFTGVTLIMSSLSRQSSFEVARSNWLFSLIMILLLSAVPLLQIINM